MVEWAEAFHDEHLSAHQHYVTNSTIDLDGDVAHVETYFILAALRHQTREQFVSGGRYVDRFERRDGRWAIATRVVICEWALDPEILGMLEPIQVAGVQGPEDPSYARPLEVTRAERLPGDPDTR
jgi:hypothetical protein